MAEKVLVVGAGPVQQPGIERAQEMGFTVIATDADPEAPGLRVADIPVVLDVKDIPGTVALARKHGVRGVFCVSVDAAVKTVAAVAHEMNLLALSPEAAENATDKYRMRTLWAEDGIPSPAFALCESMREAEAATRRIGLPVVIKPTSNATKRDAASELSSDLRKRSSSSHPLAQGMTCAR